MTTNEFKPSYHEFIQIKNQFEWLKQYSIPQKNVSHSEKQWIKDTYCKIICRPSVTYSCLSCSMVQWLNAIEYFVKNYQPPAEAYSTSVAFENLPSHLTDEALNIHPVEKAVAEAIVKANKPVSDLPDDVKEQIKNARPTITQELNTPTGNGKARKGTRKPSGESGRL